MLTEPSRLAGPDPATGLYAQRSFVEVLRTAVRQRATTDRAVAVLATNLISRGLSRLAAEQREGMVLEYAGRMQSAVRVTDPVGRLSDLDVVALCDGIAGLLPAMSLAERVLAALEPPLSSGDVLVVPDPHIGIALPFDEYDEAEDLLARAFDALRASRSHGTARIDVMVGAPDRPQHRPPFQ